MIKVKPKTANEDFLELLSKNRLMPNLSIDSEASHLKSCVREALKESNITVESKRYLSQKINYQGAIELKLSMRRFRELSAPENRNLLLAAIKSVVEELGYNPNQVSLVRSISPIHYITGAFDKARIGMSYDAAEKICGPNFIQVENLRNQMKEDCSPA